MVALRICLRQCLRRDGIWGLIVLWFKKRIIGLMRMDRMAGPRIGYMGFHTGLIRSASVFEG